MKPGWVVRDEHRPLVAGQLADSGGDPPINVDAFLGAGAAEHECPGIARVREQVVHRRVRGVDPEHPGIAVAAARQLQPVRAQRTDHLPPRPKLVEAAEHVGDRLAHRLIGAQHDPILGVIVEPDRQPLAQLALGRFMVQARSEPRPDQVQLGLAHRPLETEHQPVVELRRVVYPVCVGDQRVGQRAQIQQLVPVGVVASQPRRLDPEHDADLAQPDIGDQLPKPGARTRRSTGTAQVLIDHPHLAQRPAQRRGPLPQLVLAGQALGVLHDLRRGGLPHIHIGVTSQMPRGDLLRGQQQRRTNRPRTRLSHRPHHQ
jgi:hypothetical protein